MTKSPRRAQGLILTKRDHGLVAPLHRHPVQLLLPAVQATPLLLRQAGGVILTHCGDLKRQEAPP